MIRTFSGKTADDVWRQAISALKDDYSCSVHQSRLGATREILHANLYVENPRERWVTSRLPAINPAFAIAEVFWILAGSNDAGFINFWNPSLPKFAGGGETYHGAYGYRIINQFGVNQLELAYHALKTNPDSRQVVIQIWDAKADLPNEDGTPASTDIPCNLFSMLKVRDGKLEWTQVMRSNDLYRGTPYNFVQFTTLQEILAGWLNVDVGGYYQISDSLHVYESDCNELDCRLPPDAHQNVDNLSVAKDDFENLFKMMWQLLNELTQPDLSPKKFYQVAQIAHLPKAYRNLLLVAAADSARRRGLQTEMNWAIEKCSNPLLASLIRAWVDRWQ
ncbi:TPA: hypothetical protein DCP15_00145 [Candidatus Uhrbacteria bacterium]|nr:hypothetical protein [Candidatus Uhrbacteria bacterium]